MSTIGFTTTTFTDEPTALPGLEFAVKNGFHALELSSNHLWPEVATATELARLREDGTRHEIRLSIHFPTRFPLGSLDRFQRRTGVENLRATIGIACQIGARGELLVSTYVPIAIYCIEKEDYSTIFGRLIDNI